MTDLPLDALRALLPLLPNQRVLVVGDLILDEYLTGKATRMSREAPVPVLEFERRELIPGGAANPAANITMLGGTAYQVGVVGDDAEAVLLRQVLAERGIDTRGVLTDPTRPTTLKTRLMAHMGLRFPQQVARMDRLTRQPISAEVETQVVTVIEPLLSNAGALLASDYHGGMLTPALVTRLRDAATRIDLLLTADAQGNLEKYVGFGLVKCNAHEAGAALRRNLQTDEDFATAARDLCALLALTVGMVITRGAEGATLCRPDGTVHHCPAPDVTDVYDTVGAGDTAVAVMTLALAAGSAPETAVTLANFASGLVVRRFGNYTPSLDELADSLEYFEA